MAIGYTGPPNKCLGEVITELKLHLAELGYSERTIARLDAVWQELIVYCQDQASFETDTDLGRRFVWDRYGSVLGDKDASHNVNRAVHMLEDYLQYGMIFKQSTATLKGFSPAYKDLFEDFLNHLRQDQAAEGSIRTWRGRLFRFEYFLLRSGVGRFDQLELHHVNTYIETLAGYSAGTVGATIRILGKLFDYALAEGYHHISYANTLPCIRRTNKYRLPTVFSADEVERILAGVDRSNPLGKRNYAILLLVARLGLRISDARQLRFEQIDWKINEYPSSSRKPDSCWSSHCLKMLGGRLLITCSMVVRKRTARIYLSGTLRRLTCWEMLCRILFRGWYPRPESTSLQTSRLVCTASGTALPLPC